MTRLPRLTNVAKTKRAGLALAIVLVLIAVFGVLCQVYLEPDGGLCAATATALDGEATGCKWELVHPDGVETFYDFELRQNEQL